MLKHAFSALLLGLFLLPAQGAMYKWKDERGVTQFGQFPPPGVEAERLRAPPPPAGDPEAARQQLNERLQQEREAADQAREKRQEAARQAELDARQAAACEAARRNLSTLQRGGNRRVRLPDGTVTYLTAEQRQQRIDQARKQIREHCKEDN